MAIACVNLGNTMLSEINQIKKHNPTNYEVPRIGKVTETQNRIEVTRNWEREK